MKSISIPPISNSFLPYGFRRTLCLVSSISLFFAVFFTSNVSYADSLTVTAKVSAQVPSSPAIITSPIDQQDFHTQLIIVSGTCPPEGAYITIIRNSISGGTAPCISEKFELPLSLVRGTNHLQALVYNSTDDQGPPSAIITVYYIPASEPILPPEPFPLPSLPPLTVQPVNPSRVTPLTLEHRYTYQVRGIGKEWRWTISLQGGLAPYTCSVDWGDGQQETLDITADHILSIRHTYKSAGVFTPVVTCRDRVGTEATIQLLAVVDPGATNEPASQSDGDKQSNDAIPSYVIVGAPIGAVLLAALVHAFVIQGKLPKLPNLPKKLK